MVIKVISVVLAICIAEVTLLATQSSSDPLFLFISNSPLVVITRLLLITALLVVAFRKRFKYRLSRQVSAGLGAFFLAMGTTGVTSQTVINGFADYIKFFDFLFMILVGVVFSITALSYSYARRRLPFKSVLSPKLPKPAAGLKPNLSQSKQKSTA